MIPGDVPLVRGQDIDHLIAGHQGSPAVSIVPDREHDGTNGLAVTPPDAIDFKFGRGSFQKHISQCEELTIEPRIIRSAGFELDIDHPMDLQTLLSYEGYNETECLRKCDEYDNCINMMNCAWVDVVGCFVPF